ncbi:Ldh family oxidoreductase [Bacillus piscicola]|uniref:Ldh family oxidoreductase n=1 Tax=Bacillus piscicola TaxID=1632684 RepID=UPI001F094616|nr:Ldh family oxidoreductase [Bacillus piscicola]
MPTVQKVKSVELESFCSKILQKIGLTKNDAEHVSSLLVEADLRDHSTHGVVRLATYVDLVKHNVINTQPNIKVVSDRKATGTIDGDHGFGQIIASKAMDLAIQKAQTYGIGMVGVINSGHLGELGLIAKQVVPHRMVGSISTNGGPMMAPTGGSQPILGNNPFAVCIPRRRDTPIVVDMALSKTARGNIILAEKEGREIPEGWALDQSGNPTTDPKDALLGSVLPMAGHKGYSLALLNEIMSSALIGGTPGYSLGMLTPPDYDKPLRVSHSVTAVNIEHFTEWDAFQDQLDNLIDTIKTSAKQGETIYIPGERSEESYKRLLKTNIELSVGIIEELKRLGEEYDVAFPD